jgi:hypothetical protein
LRAYSARAAGADGAGHVGPRPAGPLRLVQGQAELVVDPAGQRAAAPVVAEELLGRGQVDAPDRGDGLLLQELGQGLAVQLGLVAAGVGGELAQVLVLQRQAEAGVGPGGQRLPVPLGGLGVGRQVLLHRLADRGAGLMLGLLERGVAGVLEAGPLEGAGLELDAQAPAGPVGEARRP